MKSKIIYYEKFGFVQPIEVFEIFSFYLAFSCMIKESGKDVISELLTSRNLNSLLF